MEPISVQFSQRVQLDTGKTEQFAAITTAGANALEVPAIRLGVFSRIADWFRNHFAEKKYVQIGFNSTPVLVKISDLSKALNVTPNEILQASDEKRVEQFISRELHIKTLYSNLDNIQAEQKANPDGRTPISDSELSTIKGVARSAIICLSDHPTGRGELDKVIPITANHKIHLVSTKDSYKITGLFGKILGEGSFGEAAQTVDLLTGNWSSTDEAVMKTPKAEPRAEEDLENEAALLKKVHKNGIIMGLQKPLKLVRNLVNGVEKPCHLGTRYDTDLEKMLEKKSLNQSDVQGIAYQLFHGLAHLHRARIAHGDIKPANIFCKLNPELKGQTLVYLADFGGGVDFDVDPNKAQTITLCYHLYDDDVAADAAKVRNDSATVREIAEKADVFATCITLFELITGKYPYNDNKHPYVTYEDASRSYAPKADVRQTLIYAGFNAPFATLICKGLEKDYRIRPTAKEFMDAAAKELNARHVGHTVLVEMGKSIS